MKNLLTFETKKARDFFLEKISFLTGPFELKEIIEKRIEEINIVDVRRYDDYIDGHIPYAIHVPYENLEDHLVMFEKKKVNVIYSYNQFCKLAAKTAYKLADEGYPVVVLLGGFHTWKKLDFEIVKTSSNEDK